MMPKPNKPSFHSKAHLTTNALRGVRKVFSCGVDTLTGQNDERRLPLQDYLFMSILNEAVCMRRICYRA